MREWTGGFKWLVQLLLLSRRVESWKSSSAESYSPAPWWPYKTGSRLRTENALASSTGSTDERLSAYLSPRRVSFYIRPATLSQSPSPSNLTCFWTWLAIHFFEHRTGRTRGGKTSTASRNISTSFDFFSFSLECGASVIRTCLTVQLCQLCISYVPGCTTYICISVVKVFRCI